MHMKNRSVAYCLFRAFIMTIIRCLPPHIWGRRSRPCSLLLSPNFVCTFLSQLQWNQIVRNPRENEPFVCIVYLHRPYFRQTCRRHHLDTRTYGCNAYRIHGPIHRQACSCPSRIFHHPLTFHPCLRPINRLRLLFVRQRVWILLNQPTRTSCHDHRRYHHPRGSCSCRDQ